MNYLIYDLQGLNSKDTKVTTPTLVSYFVGKSDIVDVQAGAEFCIVLLRDGSLHAMGHKDCCGQANPSGHFLSPILIQTNKIVSRIACCSIACTIVQTVDGEWLAFGDAYLQPKPTCGKQLCKVVTKMKSFPKNALVSKIVATQNAFFMLCDNSDLYVIGAKGQGEMGTNDGKNIDKWTLCKKRVADVQTGSCNSFVFLQ